MHTGGFFSDLTMALDCVKHEILLSTLHFNCIQGLNEKIDSGLF